MKAKIYYILIFIISLTSCEEDISPNKLVLDKIIFHENADQIGSYQYNKNALIKRYEYYFVNEVVEYTDFVYSHNNRLQSKNFYQLTNDVNFELVREDIYEYGAADKIKDIYFDKGGPLQATYSFTWKNEKLIRVDYSSSWSGTLQKTFYELEYDNRGNISKSTNFILDGDQRKMNYIVEYEYDDKVNPLLDLTDPVNFELRGPNNLVRMTQRSHQEDLPYAITEIEYSYNEFDFPQEMTKVIDLYGVISTINHKYRYKKI